MPDPFTFSAAALAIAKFIIDHSTGHIIGGEAHHFYRHFLEHWRESHIDQKTGLPHNNDLESAGVEAFRSALFVLVMELAGRIEPKKSWLANWSGKLPGGGILTKDIFPGDRDPHRRWLNGLRGIISGDGVKFLHQTLKLEEDSLGQCFAQGNVCQSLGVAFADSILEWARLELAGQTEHPDFENLVRAGWELPGTLNRVTLPHAYCLFFREHLATNPKVFNLLVTDTLNKVLSQLHNYGANITSDLASLRKKLDAFSTDEFAGLKIGLTDFQLWLEPQLDEIKNLLGEAITRLDTVVVRQGEVLVAIFTLSAEAQRGNDAAAAQLAKLRNWLTVRLDKLPGEVAERVVNELKPLLATKWKLLSNTEELERLAEHLKPIKFEARSYGLINKGFFGRKWLFESVEKWRKSPAGERHPFWITGEPGVGKSAFAAQLTHSRPDVVVAAQFVEWDKPDHRDPKRVIRSIAFQLATRLADYRSLLVALPEIAELERKNAAELFDYLLAEPLHQAIDRVGERYLIVIDALDEADNAGCNPLVELLARNAQRLPDWIGLVVTSRPENNVIVPLQGLNSYLFDTSSEKNLADIRDYLRHQLAAQLQGRNDADFLIGQILQKSEGVFLYVERFCEDIQRGHLSLGRPEQFPQGLGGIFFQYFQRQFPDLEKFRKYVRPALRAILAAREPLPTETLQRLFNWQEDEIRDFKLTLGSLFPVTKDENKAVVKPCHKSLTDWLADEVKANTYFVSLDGGHRLLADYGLNWWPRDNYALCNLPWHLAASGQRMQLIELLTSFPYISARVRDSQLFSVAKDLNEAMSFFPLESTNYELLALTEQAIRREAKFINDCRESYPQGLFQSVRNLLHWCRTPTSAPSATATEEVVDGVIQAWERDFKLLALPWLKSLRPPDHPLGLNQCIVYTRHKAEVRSLAVSDDGQFLVSGSDDGVVRAHHIATGEVKLECKTGGYKVACTLFLGLDGFVALCERKGEVLLQCWDIHTWERKWARVLTGTGDGHSCCVPMQDRKGLVVGTGQGIVLFPFPHDGEEDEVDVASLELLVQDFHPRTAVWSKDTTVAAFGTNTHVRIFRLSEHAFGKTVTVAETSASSATPLAISGDGKTLAVATWTGWAGHESIHFYETKSGTKAKAICHSSDNWPNSVDFSPCSTRIASGTNDGCIRVWDVKSLALSSEYEGHESYVTAVRWSSKGDAVFSGGTDGSVLGWDLTKKVRKERRVGHDGKIYTVAVSADQRLVASGCEACQLYVWDWESGQPVFSGECLHFVTGIVFSPDANLIATLGSEDGNLQIWNVKRGRELWHRRGAPYLGARGKTKKIHEKVNSVAFDQASETIACVEGGYKESHTIVFRSSKTGEEVRRIFDPENVFTSVAFAPTNGGIAIGCESGDVQLWTAKGKAPAATFGGLRHGIAALAFDPTQPIIVAASDEGEVAAWIREGRNWERLWYRAGPDYIGENLIFSPDGKQVALVYDAHERIRVYDMTRGTISHESQSVCSPWHLFSDSNGKSIAEATGEATIVRSSQTGAIIGRLPFHLKNIVLNREGNRLAGVLGRQLHLYSIEVPKT